MFNQQVDGRGLDTTSIIYSTRPRCLFMQILVRSETGYIHSYIILYMYIHTRYSSTCRVLVVVVTLTKHTTKFIYTTHTHKLAFYILYVCILYDCFTGYSPLVHHLHLALPLNGEIPNQYSAALCIELWCVCTTKWIRRLLPPWGGGTIENINLLLL